MPRPVHIGKKARKIIAAEVAMDASDIAEDHHLPESGDEVADLLDALGQHLRLVREIESGKVAGLDAVQTVAATSQREYKFITVSVGLETIWLGTNPDRKAARTKEIRRLTKAGRRLRAVAQDCDRYLEESRGCR